MEKKKMPVRMGLAALSTVLIASMSGCGLQKKNTNDSKDNVRVEKMLTMLSKTGKKTTQISKGLEFSKIVNNELEAKNLMGQKCEKDGVIYYNYDVDIKELNLDNFTFEEMEQLVYGVSDLKDEDKVYVREYLSNWLYYNNLAIDYENLYRIIIAADTGKEFVSLYDDDQFNLYISEGENLIKNNNSCISDAEVISSYYGVSNDAASDMVSLIKNKPDMRFMVKEMHDKKDEKFGSEDYIPVLEERLNESSYVLNCMGWRYYDKINSSISNKKTKSRKI